MGKTHRDLAIDTIRKRLGDDVLTVFDSSYQVEAVSTSNIFIDEALGVGGIAKGRIVELFGPESCGKTTLGLHVLANIQKEGDPVAVLDFEHAFDSNYASRIGINMEDNIDIFQPNTLEDGMEIISILLTEGNHKGILVDSLAAMCPKAEVDADFGDQNVALKARAMSQALRKLTPLVGKSKAILMFVNHEISKMGGFGRFGGVLKTTPGGDALKYYSTVRIQMRIIDKVEGVIVSKLTGEKTKTPVATRVKVKVVKNKLSIPYQSTDQVYIGWNRGFDIILPLIDICLAKGVIVEKPRGHFTVLGSSKKVKGRLNLRSKIDRSPELLERLKDAVDWGAAVTSVINESDEAEIEDADSVGDGDVAL